MILVKVEVRSDLTESGDDAYAVTQDGEMIAFFLKWDEAARFANKLYELFTERGLVAVVNLGDV